MSSDSSKKPRKKHFKISFKAVLSVLTLALVAFIVYRNWGDIVSAVDHIRETNIFVLLLIIPEQLLMLYSGGQIFFSYKESEEFEAPSESPTKTEKSPKPLTVIRISLESAFARQAYPSAGVSSAAFLSWRLKPYGFSPAQTSFLYLLRYFAIVCTNQLQTLIAVLIILFTTDLSPAGQFILILATIVAIVTGLFLAATIVLISSKRRISWFVDKATRFLNFLVRTVTRGKKRKIIDYDKVDAFLTELNGTYKIARKNMKILKKPILWGMCYSFCEIATYWVVSISLGHPELLPQIMIGEAVGSVAGIFLPYGLYELGMAGAMASLGVDLGLASLIVLITRVIVLGENLIPGYIVYQHTILKTKAEGKTTYTPEKGA